MAGPAAWQLPHFPRATLVSLFLNVVHYKLSFYTQNEEDVLNIIADVLHKAYLYVSLKYLNQINMLKILILKILD